MVKKKDGTIGTHAPHLYFEIYTQPNGSKKRINPAFYVKYKNYEEQSEIEKNKQENTKKKGYAKGFYGDGQVSALRKKQ